MPLRSGRGSFADPDYGRGSGCYLYGRHAPRRLSLSNETRRNNLAAGTLSVVYIVRRGIQLPKLAS